MLTSFPPPSLPDSPPPWRIQKGLTLVEMLVTLLVMIILASVAAPSFIPFFNNLAVRNTAESLLSAMQTARSEAVRSNNTVVLQVVSSLDNSCAPDIGGRYWVASHCAAAGACGNAIDKVSAPPTGPCVAPIILAKGSFDSDQRVDVNLGNPTMCFSGLGRVSATATNCPGGSLAPEASPTGEISVDISHTEDSCVTGGGLVRCLRVNISTGGQPRMCDPSITSPDDPRRC